jgi:GT2 family glycosyltransferase
LLPFKDNVDLLRTCIDSLFKYTTYQNYQIILINHESVELKTHTYLKELLNHEKVRLLYYQGAFNFSAMNNLAVEHTNSEYLVLLNNDTEILTEDWLQKLLSLAARVSAGAVGCMLLYKNRDIQHAGIALGLNGALCQNLYAHIPYEAVKEDSYFKKSSEVDAITAACMMIERSKYLRVGGLNQESLKVAFNDVDFCLRLEKHQLKNYFHPEVCLIHHESMSRPLDSFDNTGEFSKHIRAFRNAHGKRVKEPSLFQKTFHHQLLQSRHAPLFTKTILILAVRLKQGYGVDLVIRNQARALAEKGARVVIGVFDYQESHLDSLYKIVVLQPSANRRRLTQQVKKMAKKEKAVFVIAHTSPFFEVLPALSKMSKTIAYEHGDPSPHLFKREYFARKFVKDYKVRRVYPYVSKVIAISQFIAHDISRPDAAIVYNGINHLTIRHSKAERDAFCTKHQIEPTKICCLMVARLGAGEAKYKGTKEFIAFKRQLSNLEYEFLLVGAGQESDAKVYQAEGIKVLVNASNDELAICYQVADVYLSFSKWEGFNLPVAEASYYRTPTFCLESSVHFEVSRLNFKSVDEIAENLKKQTKESLQRLGGLQNLFLTRYSWQENRDKLTAILADLTNAPSMSQSIRGLISICIVTRDHLELIKPCLYSILEHTKECRFELLIADSGSRDEEVLAFYKTLPSCCTVLYYNYYNFSKLNNLLAAKARGEYLLFLNNDTEITHPTWLSALLEPMANKNVAAVGPLLCFPDGNIQHAGVEFCQTRVNRGLPFHPYRKKDLQVSQNAVGSFEVPALTGACLLLKRDAFCEFGPFDENYYEECQDIDLCLRLQKEGLRCVYTSKARVIHLENGTRERELDKRDRRYFLKKWSKYIKREYLSRPNQRMRLEC